MLKDRLHELFKSYDPAIQLIISQVLTLEQEHISMNRPRVKNKVDDIIARVASAELEQANQSNNQE